MAVDITKSDSVQNVHVDDEGTGIYWFVDDSGRYEQIFVPRITQKRAMDLAKDFAKAGGQTLDAYRWVPDRVENAQSLVSSSCGGKCTHDTDCVDNACRCIRGQCKRK